MLCLQVTDGTLFYVATWPVQCFSCFMYTSCFCMSDKLPYLRHLKTALFPRTIRLAADCVCGSCGVDVEVAYTESLQVNTVKGSIAFGFLDTMNGSAQLTTQGGNVAVDGLDGTASLQSHGGNIQVAAINSWLNSWQQSAYGSTHLPESIAWTCLNPLLMPMMHFTHRD